MPPSWPAAKRVCKCPNPLNLKLPLNLTIINRLDNDMTTKLKLTATQTTVLEAAAKRIDGNIEPLPSKLRGGARTAVIDGLLAKGLVIHNGDNYLLADVGYAAVGKKRPARVAITKRDTIIKQHPAPKDVGSNDTHEDVKIFDSHYDRPKLEGTRNARTPDDQSKMRATSTTRTGTKQATLITMLQRPDGATVNQVMESTGWLAHTVRGAISGAIKKKLGLNVVSEKSPSGERAYRIV